MNLDKHKEILHRELDQFNSILSEVLPRYIELMQSNETSQKEEEELEEIEQFLLEINSKIAELKNRLDQDLFGETINQYYQAKQAAKEGDIEAKNRLDELRKRFLDTVQQDDFFTWN